jgi:hypothetical protein
MEMFLMVASMSLFGLAICSLAFAAATRTDVTEPAAQPDRVPVPAPQFFVRDVTSPELHTMVPIEALLLQIERHVRLEQAAGESFHFAPTAESLHMKTVSELVH